MSFVISVYLKLSYIWQVTENNVSIGLQASLRKCSNACKSCLNSPGLCTPRSSIVKACALVTPKSACGSSIFSPGEAFWNEAIQVADGLFAQPCNLPPPQADKGNHSANSQFEIIRSQSLSCKMGCKSRDMLEEGGIGRFAGDVDSSTTMGKHKNDVDKKVSPFPVKHFDFIEDKILDGKSKGHGAADNSVTMMHKDHGVSIRSSVNQKDIQSAELVSHQNKSQMPKEMSGVQERTSEILVHEKDKDFDNDSKNESPVGEIKNVIDSNESFEAHTPASKVHIDRLDLSNWLPSEICSIYNKKGITQLYSWQVFF